MAQTGYTPILIYSSSTASNAPAVGNLTNSALGSELAINITDGKLFYKDSANAIQVIGWKTTPTSAGGTGLTSYTAGDLLYYATGTTLSKLAIGASGRWLGSSGTAPQWNAPAALTKTDDTNVTLTLGGSASTALLNAASLTLGWTGQLSVSRGGTGLSTLTAGYVPFGNGTSALGSNSLLSWDDTNVTLGVGINNPVGTRATLPGLVVGGTGGTTGRALTVLSTSSTAANSPRIDFYHAGNDTSSITGGAGFTFLQGTTEYARFNYGGGFSIGTTTNRDTLTVSQGISMLGGGDTTLKYSGYDIRTWASSYVAGSGTKTVCTIYSPQGGYSGGGLVRVTTSYQYRGGAPGNNYAVYMVTTNNTAAANLISSAGTYPTVTVSIVGSGSSATQDVVVNYNGDSHVQVVVELFGIVSSWGI
jgi:hypothetical protein